MRSGIDREEFINQLIALFDKYKSNKKVVNNVKKHLNEEYKILGGTVQKYFNNPKDELEKFIDMNDPEADERVLCLLVDTMYKFTGNLSIITEDYFTEKDIVLSKQYVPEREYEESLELPLVIENVTMVNSETFQTTMDIKFIKKLHDSNLLRYNPETQREAAHKRVGGTIETVAKTNKKSTREIAKHLLNGTLFSTTVTFNCLKGSSKNPQGEIRYIPNKRQLVVNEKTFIDILDGFHRIKGSWEALYQNKDLEFSFQVNIVNYNTRIAQQYVAQINTVNKMSEDRLVELRDERHADSVVKQLQLDSELRGKIASQSRPSAEFNQLVSFRVLADAIDETFNIRSKIQVDEVYNDLKTFFDYLVGYYPDEFNDKIKETKEVSLINSNSIFIGYIQLAYRMSQEGVKPNKLKDILDKIDFSRSNKMWEEIGVLDNSERITAKARKNIKEFFNNLDLKDGVLNG